jgi:hypothetical protein
MTKTHCVHGHEYTPENTAVNNRGQIFCRICSRIKASRYKAQNPDVVKAHRAKYKARAEEQAKPKRRVETRAAGGKAVLHYNDGVEAERAAIVAWLRSQGGHHDDIYAEAADDIETGAHHGKAAE